MTAHSPEHGERLSPSPERPPIKTIVEAAAEFGRLWEAFNAVAVNVTDEYIKSCLQGERGVTWDMFSGIPRQFPILPRVTRWNGAIELSAGYTRTGARSQRYRLTQSRIRFPYGGEFEERKSVMVHAIGRGLSPGAKYAAVDGQILWAQPVTGEPTPTITGGQLTQTGARSWLSDTLSALPNVTSELAELITALQGYEDVSLTVRQ